MSVTPQSASSGRARRWPAAAGMLEQHGERTGAQAIVPSSPDATSMRRYV